MYDIRSGWGGASSKILEMLVMALSDMLFLATEHLKASYMFQEFQELTK